MIRDASRRDERATARKEPGKLSLTERQLYLKARQLLADEIGAARGVDPAEADEWIGDQIAGEREREPAHVEPRCRSPRLRASFPDGAPAGASAI